MFEPQGLTRGVFSLALPFTSKMQGRRREGHAEEPVVGLQFYPLPTIH